MTLIKSENKIWKKLSTCLFIYNYSTLYFFLICASLFNTVPSRVDCILLVAVRSPLVVWLCYCRTVRLRKSALGGSYYSRHVGNSSCTAQVCPGWVLPQLDAVYQRSQKPRKSAWVGLATVEVG